MIQQSQKNNWQTKKLGKVCNIVMGQSPSSVAYNEDCVGLPLIQGSNDIKKGKTIERIYTSEITKTSEKGSIILTVRAPVGCIGIAHKKVCIGRGVCSISTEKENQNFIFYFLKFFEPKWASLEQGSTFTAVNSSDIRKLTLLLPPLPEQNRIVAILETWDEYLEKLSRKIEMKKNIKKGLMGLMMNCELLIVNGKEIYAPKLGLPGFSGEWESVKFSDCMRVLGKIKGEKKSNYLEKGKFPIIDQSQNKIAGYSNRNDFVNKNFPVIIFGDHTRILKYIDFLFILGNDGTKIFKEKKGNDIKYLYYYLCSIDIPNTGYNRHFKYIKDLNFKIPTLKEQTAIAKILTTADKEIEALEKKKKIIEEQKRFLLNNLVTGRIRV